ncbi:hypothetical protein BDB01DRAFT_274644 [Pilobolus umbonatus]|nr:hypothetical protein BDB01DRAFT_274644 [Pilobolus umbonatus]
MKIAIYLLVALVTLHTVMADIYNQLQFMKILSPINNQNIQAGEKLVFKYVMQPLIMENVSNGYAKRLDINFHKRSGDKKLDKVSTVFLNCPIEAKESQYKTYTKSWTVPKNTAPGSYAFDFTEQVQLRRGAMTSAETVKVNVVD